MPAIRRSLQAPRPDKPYLTKGHNIIPKIEEALRRNKGKGNILCIRIAIFSYKILLPIYYIEGYSQAGGRGGSLGPLTAACITSGLRISGSRPRRYWRRPRTCEDRSGVIAGFCRGKMY
ncbi:uncharacterized protein BKA55DRAFT_586673 [Fusarium redolens]|uniref:Uncharacterized protein n=1 Tax=Fusarium redolens TaxID=48865 RepID=A0A9P9FWQ5_FUSRE|nr:uncharacterized protein BKA55DRAFT_586673 [Fusarium redolens]KAH7205815.1 hypothetical protein BKA55DRAFT_586673 [Fusarium redolens]